MSESQPHMVQWHVCTINTIHENLKLYINNLPTSHILANFYNILVFTTARHLLLQQFDMFSKKDLISCSKEKNNWVSLVENYNINSLNIKQKILKNAAFIFKCIVFDMIFDSYNDARHMNHLAVHLHQYIFV